MLAKWHRIQQGFDGAHPVGGACLGLEQQGSPTRSCRHHHEIGFHVTSVLKMDATVLNGDDLGVGFDGHADFVEGREDPPDEVRPTCVKEQALAHEQGFSPVVQGAMFSGHPPPRKEPCGLHRRVVRGCRRAQSTSDVGGLPHASKGAERTVPNDVQAMWSHRQRGRARPGKPSYQPVQGAATQQDVRSVPKVSIAAGCGGGTSTKAVSGFEHDHLVTRGSGFEGRGKSGEATAHHHDPLHVPRARWNGMGLAERQGCFDEVLHASWFMGKGGKVPHDRGHLLWTAADGPSNRLLASIDRWVGAVLADDGIDMPLMGRSETASASVLARSEGLVAGTAAVDHMLQIWAPEVRVSWSAGDGRQVGNGDEIGRLTGPADVLLAIERSLLNLLGHLSGIATSARAWSMVAPGQVACTRKTVFGLLDKWAADLGGCLTHRLNRDDALMLKENDLVAYGEDEVSRVQAAVTSLVPNEAHAFIEIETTSPKQALTAALAWSQHRDTMDGMPLVIMLDNLGPEVCKEVAAEMEGLGVREHVVLEASGGITFEGLAEWKESGMDVVSTSAVNRGVPPLDLTMLMDGA